MVDDPSLPLALIVHLIKANFSHQSHARFDKLTFRTNEQSEYNGPVNSMSYLFLTYKMEKGKLWDWYVIERTTYQ